MVLPFAMTGARELLEALPRHETAHAALLGDILDVLHGSSVPAEDEDSRPAAVELSPTQLRGLRDLPTKLSRPQIAPGPWGSGKTGNTHNPKGYAKLQAR